MKYQVGIRKNSSWEHSKMFSEEQEAKRYYVDLLKTNEYEFVTARVFGDDDTFFFGKTLQFCYEANQCYYYKVFDTVKAHQ